MPSENTGHELTALSHPAISGLLQGTSHRSVGSCRVYGVLWGPRASHGPADAHGSHDVGSVSSAAFLPWSASWASSCGGVGMWGMAQVWRPQLWDEPQSCVGLGGKEGVRGGCAVWGCRWESPGLVVWGLRWGSP